MSEGIIVAIISASAVVVAAIIGLFKKGSGDKTIVKQRAKGNNTTQIGVQLEKRREPSKHE